MTVVVTRNVPDRYRGFLASCMLELAPGVYTSPHMNQSVRERVWAAWGGVDAAGGNRAAVGRCAREGEAGKALPEDKKVELF
jgi:CRISPR-associated endoribonuclease Cas2 subtype I-E